MVAVRTDTPTDVLAELADDFPIDIASNPSTPPEVLDRLADPTRRTPSFGPYDFGSPRCLVASNVSTDGETLRRLADDKTLADIVAHNPSTPADVLTRLASSDNVKTRAGVATHRSTSLSVRALLADDAEVRAYLAERKRIRFVNLFDNRCPDWFPAVPAEVAHRIVDLAVGDFADDLRTLLVAGGAVVP